MKKRSKRTRSRRSAVSNQVSAGAIVFSIKNRQILVLLLVQNNEFYGRSTKAETIDIGPKGHLERGESLLHAAHREIKEELGIGLHLDTNFKDSIEYKFEETDRKTGKKMKVNKKVIYYVAFLNYHERKNIVLSEEHKRSIFLPIDEAIKYVPYENSKQVLNNAKTYITLKYLT